MNAVPKVKSLAAPLAVAAEDHGFHFEAAGFWKFMRDEKIAWLKEHNYMDASDMSDGEIDVAVQNMLAELEDLQDRLNALADADLYRWQMEEARRWDSSPYLGGANER